MLEVLTADVNLGSGRFSVLWEAAAEGIGEINVCIVLESAGVYETGEDSAGDSYPRLEFPILVESRGFTYDDYGLVFACKGVCTRGNSRVSGRFPQRAEFTFVVFLKVNQVFFLLRREYRYGLRYGR